MLVEEHHADEAGDRRRDGIDPDQQRLVGGVAADDAIGLDGEQQADRQREEGDERREDRSEAGNAEIFTGFQHVGIVRHADEGRAEAEGVFEIEGRLDRLDRRPVEEHEDDRQLRREKAVRQVGRGELHALGSRVTVLRLATEKPEGAEATPPGLGSGSSPRCGEEICRGRHGDQPAVLAKRASSSLPSFSIVSKASLTVVSPEKMRPYSRSMISRICG
ncbi:hypothetical protein D9M72_328570 [compost metagenome]